MNHISTAQAQQQGRLGSDVFQYSHLLYHDSLNRDAGVVYLNIEAYKSFFDTVLISERHPIATERSAAKDWLVMGGFASGTPLPRLAAIDTHMEFVNYENFKIASGFELHLKARLLANDFVIHEIDNQDQDYRDLANAQKTRPISKHELFAIRSYHFNGKRNYLPDLRESSLKFSILVKKPAYRTALKLPSNYLDIIDDYRLLRNQIHLPGDIIESPNIQAYNGPIIDFLVYFINTEIVAFSNTLIKNHNLNRQHLVALS